MERPARGLGGELFEGGDGFAAEAVEFADGKDHRAFEVVVQFAEGKRRAAEAAELVAEALGGERLVFGGGEGNGRGALGDVTVGVAGDERERGAGVAVELEGDRALEADFVPFEGGAEFAVEGGVVGFPDELAGADAGPVDVTVAEAEDGLAGGVARGLDLVNAAAFLALGGIAGVEDDAVAGLERGGEGEGDGFAGDTGDGAEENAALGAEAAVGEFLIVDAAEPAGVLAAGEGHLEFVVRIGRGHGRVES